ncbi:hypothetical protein K353_00863 [Kitasatospora sp. SolWspMP-SS2h]|uniref:hypothetical protein n=1 Tax=Kitasatospora sp. SolWspMP-SS2h TaxID=1305729 RepID=UPI000DB9390F|nr:hypothetical protein [Kitasatospora sp. SolWspMP-SS2h]RAJ45365.1 hypothetical protein K353_00863 [Kitasatospora sp. SolWspMP-SS2h]
MNRSGYLAGCYVALVGTLAALGGLREDGRYYLAAVVLTLPVGLVAVPGVYLLRGLATGLGGLVADTVRPDGGEPGWLTAVGTVGNTVLFTAAGLGTVLLVARLVGRRRRRAAAP